MIEAKAVHPSFVDDVVHRGPVIRKGSTREPWTDVSHEADAGEMTEQDRCARLRGVHSGWDGQLPRQKPARPGGVDHETGPDVERDIGPAAREAHAVVIDDRGGELHTVAIVDACRDCLTNEM